GEDAVVLSVVDGAGRAEGRDGPLVGCQPGLLLHVLVERDRDGRDDRDDRDHDHQLDEGHTARVLYVSEGHVLVSSRSGFGRSAGPARARAMVRARIAKEAERVAEARPRTRLAG